MATKKEYFGEICEKMEKHTKKTGIKKRDVNWLIHKYRIENKTHE